jgi:hypothetical protein
MPLSWNEIKSRALALAFSREWQDESSEDAEAKSFWGGFFNIFVTNRKWFASFEEPVKMLGDKLGFIELFRKGVLLVEHKSCGRNRDKASTQTLDKAVVLPMAKPALKAKPSAWCFCSSATSSSRSCYRLLACGAK